MHNLIVNITTKYSLKDNGNKADQPSFKKIFENFSIENKELSLETLEKMRKL